MAKQRNQQLISEERTNNVFYDNEGNLQVQFGYTTQEKEEDGQDITERTMEYIETSQGTYVTPLYFMRQGSEKMMLETCDKCKEERYHVLLSRNDSKMMMSPSPSMKRCQRCRANLCERHYYISRFDNLPRCKWHNFLHTMYNCLLKSLLFQQS